MIACGKCALVFDSRLKTQLCPFGPAINFVWIKFPLLFVGKNLAPIVYKPNLRVFPKPYSRNSYSRNCLRLSVYDSHRLQQARARVCDPLRQDPNKIFAAMASMMGYSSGCGGRRVSKNRMQNPQHYRSSKARNSMFREEQTDLLNVFQRDHFELLETNPPSYNPEYVGTVPSHTTPRSVSASSFDEEAFLELDQSPAGRPRHYHHQRQNSNNPFEDDIFEPNRNSVSVPVHAVPVASAVPISDTMTAEQDIPFASALPIHDDGNEKMHIISENSPPRVPTMIQAPQNLPRPATRAARPQAAQFPQWQQQQQRNEIPNWLVLNPSAQRTITTSGVPNPRRAQRRWSGSSPRPNCGRKLAPRRHSALSRMSVFSRAAAGEARRKVQKKLGMESLLCYNNIRR